jgi:hypothetical protein
MQGPFLNTKRAADSLGIKPQTLYNLKHEGRGPKSYKHGRLTVYLTEDLDERMSKRIVLAQPGPTRCAARHKAYAGGHVRSGRCSLTPRRLAIMPSERTLEIALERMQAAEDADDFVLAAVWAGTLARLVRERNAHILGWRRPPRWKE